MFRNVVKTENKSEVTEFVLLGLSQTHEVQHFLFFLFLLFYVIVLPVNILIILTIRGDPQLDSPTYFFLANLAFLDVCYCSVTPPKMLADFFSHKKTISSRSCIAQLFFLHFLGGAEIFLLIAMAFDRYVAICKPLHYATLMRKMLCWVLVGTAWAGGFIHSVIQVAFVVHLPFCGPNELDNFFCDVTQVIKLACTNTYVLEFIMFVNSGLVILLCFTLLLISYGVLLIRLKTGIFRGKSKAASTCITHIIIVFIMFGPAMYVYCRPFCSLPLDKVVAVFHTVVFPLTNPMIYTLRNREILSAMKHLLVQYFLGRGK